MISYSSLHANRHNSLFARFSSSADQLKIDRVTYHASSRTRPSETSRWTAASVPASAAAVTSSSPAKLITSEQVHVHRRAKTAQSSGRPWDALTLLHQHLRTYPHDTHLISLAVSLEVKLGVTQGLGSIMLEEALKGDPDHPALIQASLRLQSVPSGTTRETSPLLTQSKCAVTLHERGRRECEGGRHSEARALFSQATRMYSSMPHAYVSWARMESSLGDVKRAGEIYEDGYKSCHPTNCSNSTLSSLDRVPSITPSLSNAQKQARKFTPLLHSWASLEESQGRPTVSRFLLREALRLDSSHLPSWMLLGRITWLLGGPEEGRRIWGRGLEVAGPSAPLLHQWAQKELRASGNIDPQIAIEEEGVGAGGAEGSNFMPPTSPPTASSPNSASPPPPSSSPSTIESSPSSTASSPSSTADSSPTCSTDNKASANKTPSLLALGITLSSILARKPSPPSPSTPSSPSPLSSSSANNKDPASATPLSNSSYSAEKDDGADLILKGEVAGGGGGGGEESSNSQWPEHLLRPWQDPSWSSAPTAVASRARARVLLTLAIEIDPSHGPSIQALAALEDRSGQTQKAQALYLSHLTPTDPNSPNGLPPPPPGALTHPQLFHSRALQLLKEGERDEAMSLLSQLETFHPNNPHLCHTLGLLAQQEGQWEKAREHFIRGMRSKQLPPALAPAPALAPECTQPSSATTNTPATGPTPMTPATGPTPMTPATGPTPMHVPTSSSASLPGLLLCYEGLAELLAFKGDLNGAKSVYEAGFKYSSRPTSRFLREYASFEKRSGSLDSASDLYRLAAQFEPSDPKTWLQWGAVERRRKRYGMAIECFRRGVVAAPTHTHLWYAYGTTQSRLGRVEEARETFTQATKMCPRSPPLWMEWAIMEWMSAKGKGIEEARRLFQCGSDPTKILPSYQHPPLFQAWAEMERSQGNDQRVGELLEQASLFSLRNAAA